MIVVLNIQWAVATGQFSGSINCVMETQTMLHHRWIALFH